MTAATQTPLVIVLEHRFLRLPDGSVWTTGPYSATFWESQYDDSPTLRVVARARDVSALPPGAVPAETAGAEFWCLPDYGSPSGLLRRRRELVRRVDEAVSDGAVLVRAPGLLGALAAARRHRAGGRFAVEVVGDPALVFSRAGSRSPLRFLYRLVFTHMTRWVTRNGACVSYVTQEYLQRRYPARSDAVVVALSDAHVPTTAMSPAPRTLPVGRPHRLLLVGSLAQPYKGVDTLLDALASPALRAQGVECRVVGGGRLLDSYAEQARRLGLGRVEFLGQLPRSGVEEQLEWADLLVVPSRTEGLPRALVEGMAKALPVVASSVGGIPELVPPERLAPAGDPAALAARIGAVLGDASAYGSASEHSLRSARPFALPLLRTRRRGFLREVMLLCAAPADGGDRRSPPAAPPTPAPG